MPLRINPGVLYPGGGGYLGVKTLRPEIIQHVNYFEFLVDPLEKKSGVSENFEKGIWANGGRHPSDDVETIQTLRSRDLGTNISFLVHPTRLD